MLPNFFVRSPFAGCTQLVLWHMGSFQVAISHLCPAEVIGQGENRHPSGLSFSVNSWVVPSSVTLTKVDDSPRRCSLSQCPLVSLFPGLRLAQLFVYWLHTIASHTVAKWACAKSHARLLGIWRGLCIQIAFTLIEGQRKQDRQRHCCRIWSVDHRTGNICCWCSCQLS